MRAIVLVTTLLLASVASAGEKRLDDTLRPYPPAGTQVLACSNGAGLWYQCEWVNAPPTPCEIKLREALIAIGPYLEWSQEGHVTLEYCDERCSLRRQLENLDRREKVQAQYKAALKECQ